MVSVDWGWWITQGGPLIKDAEDTCTTDPTMIYGAALHPRLVESGLFYKHVTCGSVAGQSSRG